MKNILILGIYLFASGLMALTDQEILLEFAEETKDLKEYKLIEEDKGNLYYLRGINKENKVEYLFISSTQDEERGYSGFNKVIVTVNGNKSIQKAVIVKSHDTKSFVRRVRKSKFLSQFIAWKGDVPIKAVTGATMTSNSVKNTISNLLKRIESIEKFKN
jgi:Na+-translocating ferredoxin:NAD+ oxidoreductase RnfG subunit